MKYKAYYHILMINDWKSIVREQLDLLVRSGLYDELECCCIGALGVGIDSLKEILTDYPKCRVVRYSADVTRFEFWTLKIAWHDAVHEKPFYGLYFHTKGVTYPGHEGGKYWRDHMDHWNIKKWRDNIKMLRKNYDTSGVKLIRKGWPLHYSGNFFWFKSSYLKKLQDPETLNIRDRVQAEFWSCSGSPRAANLCDRWVDYNCKGRYHSGVNYVHTLAYNLTTEVEKATKLLYEQNDDFTHYIVDLGFPLIKDEVPQSFANAKKYNSQELKRIAREYGSEYVKMDNVGVSQNWDAVFKMLNMDDDDILIGADPDERPLNKGWVKAMGEVLRTGYGLTSLMMVDHIPLMAKYKPKQVGIVNVIDGKNVNLNWALIGMSGKFLKAMGEVPVPKGAERYGWIESVVKIGLERHGFSWCVLPDYRVRHTDYARDPRHFFMDPDRAEVYDPESSRLLREWKNSMVFQIKELGQMSFEDYLTMKK